METFRLFINQMNGRNCGFVMNIKKTLFANTIAVPILQKQLAGVYIYIFFWGGGGYQMMPLGGKNMKQEEKRWKMKGKEKEERVKKRRK